jgi:hypothetical protein
MTTTRHEDEDTIMAPTLTGLVGLQEAAKYANCQPYQIQYLHATRQLEEPARLFGKRVYDHDALEKIKDYFARKRARTVSVHGRGRPVRGRRA